MRLVPHKDLNRNIGVTGSSFNGLNYGLNAFKRFRGLLAAVDNLEVDRGGIACVIGYDQRVIAGFGDFGSGGVGLAVQSRGSFSGLPGRSGLLFLAEVEFLTFGDAGNNRIGGRRGLIAAGQLDAAVLTRGGNVDHNIALGRSGELVDRDGDLLETFSAFSNVERYGSDIVTVGVIHRVRIITLVSAETGRRQEGNDEFAFGDMLVIDYRSKALTGKQLADESGAPTPELISELACVELEGVSDRAPVRLVPHKDLNRNTSVTGIRFDSFDASRDFVFCRNARYRDSHSEQHGNSEDDRHEFSKFLHNCIPFFC